MFTLCGGLVQAHLLVEMSLKSVGIDNIPSCYKD